MTITKHRQRSVFLRSALCAITSLTLLVLSGTVAVPSADAYKDRRVQKLTGTVEGNGSPQSGYKVTLFASKVGEKGKVRVLGKARTDGAGKFTIRYRLREKKKHVFYVLAEKGQAMLASAIGTGSKVPTHVVINERTTVATGTAFAQFIDGRKIRGNTFGMLNAVKMVENMANPKTGELGEVLDKSPNGGENSTRDTFNSMANIVASCVDMNTDCDTLFEETTPPGGPEPTTVLQAVANMTKFPSNNFDDLFLLSGQNVIYEPALTSDTIVTSWLLFIKFTGAIGPGASEFNDQNLMNGPGNIAFDKHGFAWINDNYVPEAELVVACAGLRLLKIYPWGENFPGSPFFGGGLSGAGFGISLDPRGKIWVGNFGFEAPFGACAAVAAPHDSVSVFRPNGTPKGSSPITEGHIWWPQATVPDKKGNIWVANCGNDTVTMIRKGKPNRATNIPLPGGRGAMGNFMPSIPDTEPDSDAPLLKPFGIAIDSKGRAWVTGNQVGYDPDDPSEDVGRIYRLSSDGTVETLSNLNAKSKPVLSWPMGISGDSKGNMWVSNSNSVKVPCVDTLDPQDGDEGPSITLYPADDSPPSQYTGGGLTIPWGNAIDGNDTLWVFNFGQTPTKDVTEDTTWPDTPLSHFCGVDTSKCPSGMKTGHPISPPEGYVSDALDRITGGNIDPSGNVWLLNNWKKTGPFPPVYQTNPGGNSFVIIPGAAAPVKTPLIGPPQSFDQQDRRKGDKDDDDDDDDEEDEDDRDDDDDDDRDEEDDDDNDDDD